MESYFEIAKKKFGELKNKKDVIILGIESSCDETSVSVVKNGTILLSNVIASQIDIHKRFGGVVPEVASRNHIMAIENVFNQAIKEANISLEDIDAIAVTYGAGLIGALLVGVNFAKAVAYSLNIPLIAVSHIQGHIAANYITHKNLTPPFVCLLVSGGHTALLEVTDYISHTMLGTTIDDAVGEAFDKVAIALGLEPTESDIMSEKPRKNGTTVFGGGMGYMMAASGIIQAELILIGYTLGIKFFSADVAMSIAFYSLNLIQFFYFASMRVKRTAFKSNIFKNKWAVLAILFAVGLLAIIAFTPLHTFIGLTSLNLSQWLIVIGLSALIFPITEIFKVLRNKTIKKD